MGAAKLSEVSTGGLEVRLLGPLEVERDGQMLKLGGAKVRTLLADLALHLGETVSMDKLIDDLWGEQPPDSAQHAVEEYVSQLRKKLGRTALVTQAPGYALALGAEQVDLTRFAQRAAEGRALLERDPDTASALLREALAVWRGTALAEFTFEPFAQIEIGRFEELRLQCLEDRIEADLGAGRHTDLIPELEALARAEPRRERLRAQLMRALYRSGRAADALAVYRATREALAEELGIEPGPELRELEQAILRQDASLDDVPLRATEPDVVQRKLAAVVALELVDVEGLDPEALHELTSRWQTRTATVVHRYGGRVESIAADAATAVFGVPLAREDDVLRASRAALELRDARVRIGIETGEVVASGTLVAGHVLAEAREVARGADPGAVAVGERAAALIGHAARFERGSLRLLELADEAPAFERRHDAPLVGRARQLASLRTSLDECVRDGACRAVQILGPPGIGKTRLARELSEAVRDRALVLDGVCAAEGAGSTYRPLRRIVRAAAGAESRDAIFARTKDEPVAATLAAALGANGGTPSAPEVAWAFRRFCETLAAEQPLVLVLDDVHWAEPTLLELIEQLAARGRGPMLLLPLAREELRNEHPSFLDGGDRIVLDALSAEETSALVQQLLGERPFTSDLIDRVVEAAEGNPLFLEQLLAFVAEEGALVGRPLPPTIRALLAARLDRLGPGERAVLTRAAVVGREFRLRELEALLEPQGVATVERHLRTLSGRGFVQAAEDAYRFRHVLVQEAVYRASAKAERAALHERLADHFERAEEPDELIGFHLERAYLLQSEVGTDDRRLRQLATDAGRRLGAAGMVAWKRNDVHATVGLLVRATDLLPADSSLARALTCELGLALRAGGEAERATDALKRAERAASSAGDAHIELRARMELSFLRLLEDTGTSDEELLTIIQTAIPAFEALRDDRALGRAWLLSGFVEGGRHLRCKAWEESSERALDAYRRAGLPVATCLGQLAQALYQGPTPAPEAIARCERLLDDDTVGPAGEANVRVFLGGLLAMRGQIEEARAHVARARETFDELGQLGPAGALCGGVGGAIEVLAGDWQAAELVLRESCELLQRARLNSTFATRAGELAATIYEQGRFAEADTWSRAAERAAAEDDLDARLAWQPVRAKLLARSGEHDDAERMVRAAGVAAQNTDALNKRARVLLDLADVLRLVGREGDTPELIEQARRDFEQKGNLAGADRIAAPSSA
jgi:DNA-binding SARP family transcriptional activator